MYKTLNEANAAVIAELKKARPHLVDVKPAETCIPALHDGMTLLHAGPPIDWPDMTGPMRGAVLGACLFEKWAASAAEAEALAASGSIRFLPCHDNSAVGPMGGITSAHMPVLVVRNAAQGNVAYCNLNEGIGKVMRFGAFEGEVQTRLAWMRDVLGPTLSAAFARIPEGIDLTTLMAQAITMGDEFHQRNIAASALLLKALAPHLVGGESSASAQQESLAFLGRTDQFFLNVAMAYGKCVMDAGAKVRAGSIVTALTRNGRDFGIRVSGLGARWFTAPVNTPSGLFFTGYTQEDASPDIGDSAITETLGIGGAAMIAAPGAKPLAPSIKFNPLTKTTIHRAVPRIAKIGRRGRSRPAANGRTPTLATKTAKAMASATWMPSLSRALRSKMSSIRPNTPMASAMTIRATSGAR